MTTEALFNALDTEHVVFVNCQSFLNGLEKALGHEEIPEYYKSSERLEDPEHVYIDVLDAAMVPETGDVCGFSPAIDSDPKRIHIGMLIHVEGGDYQVLHASNDGILITPIEEMLKIPRYLALRFIKRAKIINREKANYRKLNQLGLIRDDWYNATYES